MTIVPPPAAEYSELGALRSLGPERDAADAALVLEIVGTVERWKEQDKALGGTAANKMLAYGVGFAWELKRVGIPIGAPSRWSEIPWSAAARATIEFDESRGRPRIRRTPGISAPLTVEHVVPKNDNIFRLLGEHARAGRDPAQVADLLLRTYRLAIVTREEGTGAISASLRTQDPYGLKNAARDRMRRDDLPEDLPGYRERLEALGLPWAWARYIEIGYDLGSFLRPHQDELLDPRVLAHIRSGREAWLARNGLSD